MAASKKSKGKRPDTLAHFAFDNRRTLGKIFVVLAAAALARRVHDTWGAGGLTVAVVLFVALFIFGQHLRDLRTAVALSVARVRLARTRGRLRRLRAPSKPVRNNANRFGLKRSVG